ncbi:MAG TPA: hypothetical protein VIV66_00315 [Pyrinomonadaceae bacterium]
MKVAYVRLYADSSGESHFEDLHEELTETDFAPPAAPLNLSTLMKASKAGFLGAPAGWKGDWHPSSGRNLFFVISGEWEIEASDGEIRRFGPGSIVKVEDTSGKGHASRVIGNRESLTGIVELAD